MTHSTARCSNDLPSLWWNNAFNVDASRCPPYRPVVQRLTSCFLLCLGALSGLAADPSNSFPAPRRLGETNTYGRAIQRTMTLLATSTPEQRNTVKILFYGQSITEQRWTKLVSDDLRRRFPHANLIIENRAIGGHSSQLLVKTAEADLYPFYPDLLIFHVYGSHIEYENIIRRVRERTTAEVLMQTDHVTKDADITEETDPTKLTPKQWNAFMNHSFLPATAKKYGTELCDQHTLWKHYLQDQSLSASNLLRDSVHLNAHGEFLMAEFVKAYLRYDPTYPQDAWKDLMKTYRVGADVEWTGGRLVVEFEGNRVDVMFKGPVTSTAKVLIDGKKPSEFPELYGFTRTSAYPGANWPCLLRVSSEKPLLLEEWTLTLSELSDDHKVCKFTLAGSKTGPDGEGTSETRFVSRSGRVVIEPGDWNLAYSRKVFNRPLPVGHPVKWRVVPFFVDEWSMPASQQPGIEPTVTLAQGLSNSRHKLEILGKDAAITAIRVYRPPVK